MTRIFNKDDAAEAAGSAMLLAETLDHYEDAARALAWAIREIKQGRYDQAKEAAALVKELKTAFHLVMDERTRVEKLGRQTAGIVHDYALDFDAARAEIGRRLACLRERGGD